MPVLLTIATINYLFKSKPDDPAGFLNPAALRNKIQGLPDGAARIEALEITDQLDALVKQYDDATDDAMGAYIADVERYDSTADNLLEDLRPIDELRWQTLPELIRLRQSLIDTLTQEEWDQVFG